MSNEPLGLIARLLTVAPTERSERLEDFLTECLAFLCEHDLRAAGSLRDLFVPDDRTIDVTRVRTQVRGVKGCRFDLVLGGPLGEKPALVLENKVGSDFSVSAEEPDEPGAEPTEEHQLDRYLRATRDRQVPPVIGAITVSGLDFAPTESVDGRAYVGRGCWIPRGSARSDDRGRPGRW